MLALDCSHFLMKLFLHRRQFELRQQRQYPFESWSRQYVPIVIALARLPVPAVLSEGLSLRFLNSWVLLVSVLRFVDFPLWVLQLGPRSIVDSPITIFDMCYALWLLVAPLQAHFHDLYLYWVDVSVLRSFALHFVIDPKVESHVVCETSRFD